MKMLKSKNIRRICVLLAMLAPVVYLFGSLFAGLTGAHGTEVFAEPVYNEEYVSASTVVEGKSYKFVVTSFEDYLRSPDYVVRRFVFSGDLGDNSFDAVYFTFDSSGTSRRLILEPYYQLAYYVPASDVYNQVFNEFNFYFDGSSSAADFVDFMEGDLFVLVSVPTSEVPENAGAYSDYVFKNFFAKDNFLEQIGKDVLSETPHGFVPFASFWKYLDNNMLHMGDMQLGLMGYGYVYYCCHVLLFDIAFILVTFFLDFIQKVNDKVVGGVD